MVRPRSPALDPTASDKGAEMTDYSKAACAAEDVDPEWFYPSFGAAEAGVSRAETLRTVHEYKLRARTVCALCPIRLECLAANFDDEFGIYGGLTADERVKGGRAVPWRAGPDAGSRPVDTEILEQFAAGVAWEDIERRGVSRRRLTTEVGRRVAV